MKRRMIKVANQPIREIESTMDYGTQHSMLGLPDGVETSQANPDVLTADEAYWAVSDGTKEIQARVRLMMEKAKQVLTGQQYNAFVLVDLKELKLREAAKVMELTYGRVDQLVKRARLKLQRVYEGTAGHV
jgi:DNA-directed RNA polymerase specialized sigma24 family protein